MPTETTGTKFDGRTVEMQIIIRDRRAVQALKALAAWHGLPADEVIAKELTEWLLLRHDELDGALGI